MKRKSPRKPTLREIIKRQVDSDPITIQDRENFKAKWGEYPLDFKRRK